jgi:hypothetical protein
VRQIGIAVAITRETTASIQRPNIMVRNDDMDLNSLMQFVAALSNDEKVKLGIAALGLAAKGSASAVKTLFTKKQKQELRQLVRLATDDEIRHYAAKKAPIAEAKKAVKKAQAKRSRTTRATKKAMKKVTKKR